MTPDRLSSTIVAALDGLVDDEVLSLPAGVPDGAGLRRPRATRHGDWTSTIALALADDSGLPALELAGLLADRLRDTAGVRSVEVAPPGFVNLRVEGDWSVAARLLESGAHSASVVEEAAVFGDRRSTAADSDADPLYLVQRAHARACSLLRAGSELGIVPGHEQAPPPGPAEAALLRLLADFSGVVAAAARRREWHRLGRLLEELATGLLDLDPAVLPRGDDPPTEAHRARLLLVAAARVVLASGLAIAGTTPAERW